MSYKLPGPVYHVPFSATTLTTNALDVWCITAGSSTRVAIEGITLGQITETAASTAELPMAVTMLRGSTAASAGTGITPVNVRNHTNAPTATSSARGPSTTVASSASASLVYADAWTFDSAWKYEPCDPIILNPSQVLAVRLSAPADAMDIIGTLTFREIGLT